MATRYERQGKRPRFRFSPIECVILAHAGFMQSAWGMLPKDIDYGELTPECEADLIDILRVLEENHILLDTVLDLLQ